MASRGMKTYSESAEFNCEICKCQKHAENINSVFVIRAALWAEELECFLEYYWR